MDLHMIKITRMGDKIRWLVILFITISVTALPVEESRRLLVYVLLAIGAVYNLLAQKVIPWESIRRPYPMHLIVQAFIVADVLEISAIVYLTGGIVSFAYPFLIFDLLFVAFFFPALQQIAVCLFVISCDALVVFTSAPEHHTAYLAAFWQFIPRACLYVLATWFPSALVYVVNTEKEKNEKIVSNLRDGVVVLDAQKQIVTVNPRAEEMLEARADSLIGKSVADSATLLPNSRVSDVLGDVALAGASDQTETRTEEMTLPEPKALDLRVITVPLGGRGPKPGGWLKVCQDISGLKEVERLRTQAISYVAHELRSPLTAIKLYACSLRDHVAGLTRESQREFVSGIIQEADRLAKLVTDLMDFARLQAGRITLRPERLSLAAQIALVKDVFGLQARAKNLALDADVPRDLPDVEADRDRLMQVFHNLLSNALRFTPPGGKVAIAARPCESGWVCVSVRDSGPGIDPEHLSMIFEKFVQLGNGKVASGAGLGLAICKEIVESHGGRIWAESEEGKGSAFCFTLPVCQAASSPEASAP